MIRFKKTKTFLLTSGLALGLSCMVTINAYAAAPSTYTIVSGDSLYKISQIFNTSIDKLMNDNNLKTYSLNIGQELKVPCTEYTVQKGDTIFLIAKKFNIPMTLLQRANNIYNNYLDIGQTVIIPLVSSQSATATTSSAAVPAPASTTTAATAPAANSTEQAAASSSVINYTAAELDLLARLIHAEAQGEPYTAKVAVGAVVINRVQSGQWANTIKGVIYQNFNGYYQFTPVVNGWIDKPADDDAVKAAKEALSGADPSNGAQFYYDNGTTNQWMLSKQVSTRIGNMVFAL